MVAHGWFCIQCRTPRPTIIGQIISNYGLSYGAVVIMLRLLWASELQPAVRLAHARGQAPGQTST
jgi:hypothetical protein